MVAKYIPKVGDWFNAYQTSESGKKYKHSLSPMKCAKILYQVSKGKKYPLKIETENFSLDSNVWEFEKVEKPK